MSCEGCYAAVRAEEDRGRPFRCSPVSIVRPALTMGLGEYPAEYNPKVHGPYDPARYYGKGKVVVVVCGRRV